LVEFGVDDGRDDGAGTTGGDWGTHPGFRHFFGKIDKYGYLYPNIS
jgi:hypothetical protein